MYSCIQILIELRNTFVYWLQIPNCTSLCKFLLVLFTCFSQIGNKIKMVDCGCFTAQYPDFNDHTHCSKTKFVSYILRLVEELVMLLFSLFRRKVVRIFSHHLLLWEYILSTIISPSYLKPHIVLKGNSFSDNTAILLILSTMPKYQVKHRCTFYFNPILNS